MEAAAGAPTAASAPTAAGASGESPLGRRPRGTTPRSWPAGACASVAPLAVTGVALVQLGEAGEAV